MVPKTPACWSSVGYWEVSFFEQELRNSQPVSIKWLEKAWEQLN